jgi:hypothetical protein
VTIQAVLKPALTGVCFQALTFLAAAPATAASISQSPPAQVWVLNQSDPAGSFDIPTIYANGVPVGESRPGTVFSANFAPGTYTFTVPSDGTDTNQAATIQLAPGSQVYLEVQKGGWVGMGDTEQGHGRDTLYVRPISASWAQRYLPTLTQVPHS